jgi:hypothetical protein
MLKRGLLISLSIAALLLWIVSKNSRTPLFSRPTQELAEEKLSRSFERAARSHRLKMDLIRSTQRAYSSKPSDDPSCVEDWTKIENYQFSNSAAEKQQFPSIGRCNHLPAELQAIDKRYRTECSTVSEKNFADCEVIILFYRSLLHDRATSNVNVETSTDLALLMEKLIASMSNLNPLRIEKIATRMHELEHDFYEPVKAMVLSRFLMTIDEPNENLKSEKMLALEKILGDAKDFGIYDPELLQAEVFLKTRGFQDIPRMEQEGERIAVEFPDRGWGDYAVAGAKFKQKDYEGTKTHLVAALKREPQNENYKKTLEDLKKDPANFDRHIFTVSFGMTFDMDENNLPKMKQRKKL